MRWFNVRRQLRVLILFLVLSAPLLSVLVDVFPFVPQVQPVAASWAPLPTTWMNVTGGTASQSWIFRVGWPPAPFSLDIQVGGVTNLFAWGFKLRWNASILNFTRVDEGDFLKSGGSTVFYNQTFQDEVGWDYILVNCTLQAGGTPVSGSGRIATVSFTVQDSGKTPLDLYETRLVDSSQAIIKHGVTDGCVLSGDSAIIYPLLYVVPQTSVADPNEMFNVTVGLDQVENLYTYDITIKWYPPQLLLVNLSPNVTDLKWLYSPFGYGFTWTKNEAAGTVSVLASRTGDQDGKTGSGLLTTITFRVSPYYTGKTFLNFTDTILTGIDRSDPDNPFLYPIDHETFGGFFRTAKPRAFFDYEPKKPAVNQTITFNATNSEDPAGLKIVSYSWNFDDGTTITENDPITYHAFKDTGQYNVTLTVTNSEGDQGTYFTMLGPVVLRDIAITAFAVSHRAAMQNTLTNISATVKNQGTDKENFLLNATVLDQASNVVANLGSYNITLYTQGATTTRYFNWTTSGVALGTYTIKVVVPLDSLPGENYPNNNGANATISVALYNLIDYPVPVGGTTFHVFIKSNSTLPYPPPFEPSSFYFNRDMKEIGFNITGPSDSFSYSNVTIPKTLLRCENLSDWQIRFDGRNLTESERSISVNATHTVLYFNYTLSEHKIQIVGTTTLSIPIASFTVSPTKQFVFINEVLTFNASNSYDKDGPIEKYYFDFGDKSNATGTPNYDETGKLLNVSWVYKEGASSNTSITTLPAFNHTFKKPAVSPPFNVTLTVTDNDGLSDTVFSKLSIFWPFDIAISGISVSKDTVNIGEILTINVTVTNKVELKGSLRFDLAILGNNSELAKRISIDAQGLATTPIVKVELNTTNVALGVFALKATVNATDYDGLSTGFPLDLNQTNNVRVYGDVLVKKWDSKLDIDVSSTTATIGSSLIVKGTLSPVRVGAGIKIQTKLGENDWNNTATVSTRLQGQYNYVWTPATAGTYQVRASWSGDAITSANVSSIKTVVVKQLSSSISLEVAPSSITIGSKVVISGKIEPSRPNAQVTVYVRLKTGQWNPLPTTVTDAQSNYSLEWTPTETGTYEIQAKWAGDVNTLAGESEIKELRVEAAELPMTLLYAVIAAAIIGIVAVAVYFLKFRRAK